ncbi:hypothetical protein FACS189442_2810 [Spirochaetia bacterium]|nr:hypothetical protein FACS189442_2810 [Spirochaetia bacterium]
MTPAYPQVRLGDVISTNASTYSEKDNWEYVDYLDTGNITENRINDIQRLYPAQDKLPSRAKRKLQKNDIIYSTVRPIQKHYGLMKEIPPNLLVSTGFTTITSSQKVDSGFIYYYLTQNEIVTNLQNIAEQSVSAYPSIRPSDIEDLQLVLPPLPIQRSIAATLSCLDDKIELNNRINANLEAQAQAIFKSWFMDFEPFQDGEFIDSELGKIPKGWEVGTLGDMATITMGQSPDGESYNRTGEGLVFYQGRTDFGWRYPTIRLFTTEPKRLAKKGDILLSVRAPVGDLNIAKEDCCIGRGLAAINSKKQSFIFYAMLSLKNQFDMFNGEGTVFGCINKDDLYGMKIIIPPENTIFEFENTCLLIDNDIFTNCQQNIALAAIHDTLLPRLMSGEIGVGDL